eukprot:GHUV01049081.1.p1 GENE.GHUV01049081.1~~GHUV01049081.1.p1  ORF type:complete len:118 (-),score=23.48 GHUV01049081.1:54-377(-)
MATISARAQQSVAGRAARSSVARPATVSRSVRAVQVRAQEAAAPVKEEAPKWTEPTLDANTPSPIFGGSTGGLLKKAQVRTAAQQTSLVGPLQPQHSLLGTACYAAA